MVRTSSFAFDPAPPDQNAAAPEFVLEDVFLDSKPKRIVATFKNAQLDVYVGDFNWHASARLTPECAVIWSLYPRSFWKFQMNTATCRSSGSSIARWRSCPWGYWRDHGESVSAELSRAMDDRGRDHGWQRDFCSRIADDTRQ